MDKLFYNHMNLRQQLQGKQAIPGEVYQQYCANITSTFISMKDCHSRTINQIEVVYSNISNQLKNIFTIVENECYRRRNTIKMEVDKGTYDKFRRLNVDSEVLRILNEDDRYQILYSQFFNS